MQIIPDRTLHRYSSTCRGTSNAESLPYNMDYAVVCSALRKAQYFAVWTTAKITLHFLLWI